MNYCRGHDKTGLAGLAARRASDVPVGLCEAWTSQVMPGSHRDSTIAYFLFSENVL